MLTADTDLAIATPRNAASAYGLLMRKTESARNIEYQVFAQATAAMQEADLPDAHFTSRIAATHRNRELWDTLACLLACEENALPETLRAKLISLALWVSRETRRVLRDNLPLTDLIEVNRTIMQGLCPQPDEAS
jgi:flagellar biosynthesis activator protein FlaF